jgi:hypothetical protein
MTVHYITKKPEFTATVEVKQCPVPNDLTQVRFERKSIKEDGTVFHESNYEMFLGQDEINGLINALKNHD